MRIRKYDFNYGRRMLLEKVARGVATAGVLAPIWPMIGESADVTRGYPDELLHPAAYTKGKITYGDTIDASTVDVVKELLDPIVYQQVKTMGRRIKIVASTKDVTKNFPHQFLMASLKNKGKARMDASGNTYADDGSPWLGGLPYPEPASAVEAMANLTLSWGRHNFARYPLSLCNVGPDGAVEKNYEAVWAELQVTGRTDGTVFQDKKDLCRLQSVWFTGPEDVAGSSFLNSWYYDQRKFPDFYGHSPAFKGVRQFANNQRFEPLVAGSTFFLSDAWAAGDPLCTWGHYRIIGRQPFLGAVGSANFTGGAPNWECKTHGGPLGNTFYNTYFELIPEVIVVEAQPLGYPQAPVSKKTVWIDARNLMHISCTTTDRRGQLWKSFETGSSQCANEKLTINDPEGYPDWSWLYVHCHDIQSNRMTRIHHAEHVAGGCPDALSAAAGEDVYAEYMTVQAESQNLCCLTPGVPACH